MNSQRWLSMSFSAFFFTWGIFLPYWTGWLTIEKGLFVTAASFITGAGMIARSLSTFIVFPYLVSDLCDEMDVSCSTYFNAPLLAGVGSTTRWLLISSFPYISVFIGTQILHAVSVGVAHFAFLKFISRKLPHDQIATAQRMYVAFALSLSTAILTFPRATLISRYVYLFRSSYHHCANDQKKIFLLI